MADRSAIILTLTLYAAVIVWGMDYRFDKIECHLNMPNCEEASK